MEIKVRKLNPNARIPTKAHTSDSGWDLYCLNDITIPAKSTIIVPTGLSLQLPSGYEMQVRPRSGVSTKTTIRVIFGTIDNAYRGEIGVMVDNIGEYPFLMPAGYKLAQGVLTNTTESSIVVVDELDNTNRGNRGFGSSGV